ncbi:3'-5' exonuclease [Kordiimonas marina]|uniref:3'-5' exonuclease n=1 Tax=Kordiimonas marina TaxID=2872312 RepID=UPI001FF6BEE6|nr:3'-5' exonuclease [Kordiimonas marina]MCJ9429486.1 3'-5' exonuclease [Kordiimonas marina]
MKVAVLDFETADTGADSACALGLVLVEDGQIVMEESYLIRPPRQTFLFTDIHGITWADVCDAPTFEDYLPEINDRLADARYIAAHNAGFDRKVLWTCYGAAGHRPPPQDTLCTVKLARNAWGLRPTTLPDVCAHFGFELDHHDALSDARACARIVMEALAQGIPLDRAKLGPPSYQVRVHGNGR